MSPRVSPCKRVTGTLRLMNRLPRMPSLSYLRTLSRSSNGQPYLGCMKNLQDRNRGLRRSAGWKGLLNSLSKECAVTIRFTSGALCANLAIVQNSQEIVPKSLGLLTVVLWLHGVSNSLALASFVDKLVSDDELLDRVTGQLQDSDLVELANVFTIPQSSLIWCLFSTALSLVCYLKRGATPILSTMSRSHNVALDTSGKLPCVDIKSSTLSPPVAVPMWALVIIGVLSVVSLIRFALVKRSLARVFDDNSEYDEEARVADAEGSSQPSVESSSSNNRFSVAQAVIDCADSLPRDSDCG